MAKKQSNPLIDLALGKGPPRKKAHKKPQSIPESPPVKPTPQRPTKRPRKGTLKKYHIRFDENNWKILQSHFEQKGLSCSAGVRMILMEWMKREGLG